MKCLRILILLLLSYYQCNLFCWITQQNMVGQFYYEQTPPESFSADLLNRSKSAFSTGARVLLSIHRSLKISTCK